MHNLSSKIVRGRGEAKAVCERFDRAALYIFFALNHLGIEISSVDEAWLVKKKGTNIILGIE